MKRGGTIVTIVLVPILIGVASFVFLPREPEYQGKRLSAWLMELNLGYDADDPAFVAIREMGTNTLPTLYRMLATRDSRLKRELIELAGRQSVIRIDSERDEIVQERAAIAYCALGAKAKSAVPDIIALLRSPDHPIKTASIFALGGIGPEAREAIPILIEYLKENDDHDNRRFAADALGRIGPEARDALPLLLSILAESRAAGAKAPADLPYEIAFAVASIRSGDDASLAPLIQWLRDSNAVIRVNAAGCLGYLGAVGRGAIPELKVALNDPDPEVRRWAAIALKKIDPETATPAGVESTRAH